MDDNELLLRIRMTHAEAHPSFPASFRKAQTGEFKMETTPKPVPKQPLFTTAPMLGPVGGTEVPPIMPRDEMGQEADGGGPMLEQPLENGGPPLSPVRQDIFSNRSLLIHFCYSLKFISRQISLLN
jgi:hypothetical protein